MSRSKIREDQVLDSDFVSPPEMVVYVDIVSGTLQTNIDNLEEAATLNADTVVSGNVWVLDEDDMSSDSADRVATQQSIKSYVSTVSGNLVGDADNKYVLVDGTSELTGEWGVGNAYGISEIPYLNFNTAASGVVEQAGGQYWNDEEKTMNIVTGLGPVIQVGHEFMVLVYNTTSGTLTNGKVVYGVGTSTSGIPNVGLAKANSYITLTGKLGLVTANILPDSTGLVTLQGKVRGINTSLLSLGPMYVSADIAGELTSTRPQFPNYSIAMGTVGVIDALDGLYLVGQSEAVSDTVLNFWNGVFRESFNFIITSDGSTISGSLGPSNGYEDLTMIFSDGLFTLDTTPEKTVALTPGTDTNPQTNYIYIPDSTKILTVDIGSWPTAQHIKVAQVLLQSATATKLDGALRNQNWNDHIEDTHTFQGHLSHITEKLRQFESQWDSGVEGSAVIDTGPDPDSVVVKTTAGIVYQLHKQNFPLNDMTQYEIDAVSTVSGTFTISDDGDLSSLFPDGRLITINDSTANDGFYTVSGTNYSDPAFVIDVVESISDGTVDGTIGDDIHVVNDSISAYISTTDLSSQVLDATGATLANSSFSFVVWGVQNKTGQPSHLMLNLPVGSYSKNSPDSAVSDASNYSVYDIPKQFQGVGFLIARFTFVLQPGGVAWSLYSTEDLRGKIPNVSAGGGGGGGGGVTTYLGLTDTPNAFTSQSLLRPRVNSGENSIEFAAVTHTELTTVTSDQHHPQLHASTHITGGGDTIADVVISGSSGLMSGDDKAKLDGISVSGTGYLEQDGTTELTGEWGLGNTYGISEIPYLDFYLMPSGVSHQEGRLHWNDDDGTLDLGMPGGEVHLQIGQELNIRCRNNSGVLIPNGAVVCQVGSVNDKPIITLAISDSGNIKPIIGVATEDIANNSFGYVTTRGFVREIDTNGYPPATILFLSDTVSGTFTPIPPTAPNSKLIVGSVIRQHETDGTIGVRPTPIMRAMFASDVLLAAPNDTEFLRWNTSNSRFELEDDSSITHDNLSGLTTDNHHAEIHAASHRDGGGDNLLGAPGEIGGITPPIASFSGIMMSGNIDMYTNNVVNLAAPSIGTDAATKDYVDNLTEGLKWKDSAIVATTGDITLSGEQTIDGVLTSSNRILVKDQSDGTENGIYITDSSAWSRSADADSGEELVSSAINIEQGSISADVMFVCTNDSITLGVTDIVFVTLGSTISHNNTTGLQGGQASEYYHLTATEHTNFGVLTDDSMADSLHRHSELSASDGSPNPALTVDASGNVGIGTNNPLGNLHIEGTSAAGAVSLGLNNTVGGFWTFMSIGASHGTMPNSFSIYDNTAHRFVIDGSGNVGIGTDTPGAAKLHVYSGASGGTPFGGANVIIEHSTTNLLQFLSPNGSVTGIMFGDADNDNQGYVRYSHVDDEMSFWTDGITRMTIDSDGNVGIGASDILFDESPSGYWGDAPTYLSIEGSTPDGAILQLGRSITTTPKYAGAVEFLNTDNTSTDTNDANGRVIGKIVSSAFTDSSNVSNDGGGSLEFYVKPLAGNLLLGMSIGLGGDVTSHHSLSTKGDLTILSANNFYMLGGSVPNYDKYSAIIHNQYDVSGQPEGYAGYNFYADSSDNTINIGGSLSDHNAATSINFYTAANTSTRTGITRMTIDSDGNVGIGTSGGITYKLAVIQDSTNAMNVGIGITQNPVISSTGNWYATGLAVNMSQTGTASYSNTGYHRGVYATVFGGVNNNDLIVGLGTSVGHYTGNTGTTDDVFGIQVTPYASAGTINNFYYLYMGNRTNGGTIGSLWGIYQQDTTAKNYFAGNVGINNVTPLAKLHIKQTSTTAGAPVLILEQADVSEGSINFIGSDRGTIATGANSTGSIRIEINGVVRVIPYYTNR